MSQHHRLTRRNLVRASALGAGASMVGAFPLGLAAAAQGTPAAGTPAPDATVVDLWHSIPPETQEYWETELLPPFYALHPECSINSFNYGREDPERIRAAVQAGGDESPDGFWLASLEQGAYAEAGVLADVQGFLDERPELRDNIVPSLLELSSYEGVVRTLPWMTNNLAMWLNLDAFEEAGVPVPSQDPEQTWTWEEFAEAAAALTSGDRSGFMMPVSDNGWVSWCFHAWIAQAGGEFITDGQPTFASEAGIEAMRFLKGMVDAGSTVFAEPRQSANAGPWYAGAVAIHLNGPWNFPTLSTFEDFPFTVVPYPRNERPATNPGGNQLYILEKEPEVVDCMFAYGEYMLSDEFQIAFNIQSGNFPVTTTAVESEAYQAHVEQYPFLAGWINQIPYGAPRSSMPAAVDMFNIFGQAYDEIMLNDAPIEETLQQAAQQAQALL